jgi:glycosyltransferase involved in cell wall biosynthesis
MNGRSLVSVIIPVYNGDRYLGEAIESILAQDYRPIEVIVVNDGSTDNTETIAKRYDNDIIYVLQENCGPAAARNKGLRMASGDIVGFLDVDDLWSRDKLQHQLLRLNDTPSAEIVLGYTQIMILTDIVEGRHIFRKWSDPVLALSVGSALFRRSVFDKVGRFDGTQHYCDDWDWFMRARERGVSILIHREVTQFYRRHERNMTNQEKLGNCYFIRMLKKSLDRRRQENCGQAESLPRLSCVGEESTGRLSGSAKGQAKD